MEVKDLLGLTVDRDASDLHLIVGVPPVVRIQGELMVIPNVGVLTQDELDGFLRTVMTKEQLESFLVNKEIDFAIAFSSKARFRVNAYTQKASPALSFRKLPLEIPSIDSLNLPRILHSFTSLKQGLILVTGPTGHGKSTTIASLLEEINMTRGVHIVTIEDPLEFVFTPQKSIISQRQIKTDTLSWSIALKSVLRQDPNIVFIGEMRDHETISAALTIAETGHLVFATLHTNSAAQSIDRIVDVFPEEQQSQVRLQLSNVVEAVFSQRLIPALKGGRTVAYELMLGTSAIRNIIREGKTHQINSVLQTSQEAGMNTLEVSLAVLVKSGVISLEIAQSYSLEPQELNRLVREVK